MGRCFCGFPKGLACDAARSRGECRAGERCLCGKTSLLRCRGEIEIEGICDGELDMGGWVQFAELLRRPEVPSGTLEEPEPCPWCGRDHEGRSVNAAQCVAQARREGRVGTVTVGSSREGAKGWDGTEYGVMYRDGFASGCRWVSKRRPGPR